MIRRWVEAQIARAHSLGERLGPQWVSRRWEAQQFALARRGLGHEAMHRRVPSAALVGEAAPAVPEPVFAAEADPLDGAMALRSGEVGSGMTGEDAVEAD